MRTLASLASPISSLVVSPDGSKVITSSSEGIGFLDLSSGQRSVTALDDEVSRLAWGPEGLLAGTSSGEVWSLRDAPVRLFEAIDEEISGIAAAGDGTIAVCGGEPFAVATFGPHGNEEWRGEPYKWPYCVRFSPDGKLLAVATWDGYLFVFDAHDLPDELDNVDGEPAGGPIFDARFLPGDRVLVVGASFVRVWDRGAGSYTSNRELDAEAFAVAVSPDGSCAVVSTNDQRLRLFGLPELTELGQLSSGNKLGKALSSFPDYAEFCHVKGPATIRTLAFHPDGTRLFGATEDRRIVEVGRAELQQVAAPVAAPRPIAARVEAAPAPAPARAAAASKSVAARAAKMSRASAPAGKRAAKAPAARKPAVKNAAARKPAVHMTAARKLAASTNARKLAASTTARKLAASTTAAWKLAANTTAARKPGVNTTAAWKLAVNTTAAWKLAANTTAARKPGVNTTAAKKSAVNTTAAKKPGVNTTAARKPAVNKATAWEPAAGKPVARKPAAKKPAVTNPARRSRR